MFETTFLRERSVRAWAMPASVAIQSGIVGTMVLVPLLFFDALPPFTLIAKASYLPLSPTPLGGARATGGAVVSQRASAIPFTAPRVTPKGIAEIVEEPPGLPLAGPPTGARQGTGVPDGVPFGIGEPDARTSPPAAPPPPPVVEPAAPPKPPERVRVGGVVLPPALLHEVRPVYPPLARTARISGPVRLDAIIGRDGRIQSLRLVSGHPILAAAAFDAVRQWVYRPTLLNGEPVEVILQIDVNFTLASP
jgi:protein TonB